MPTPTEPRRIGLVLGAGGLTGTAFHGGVIAALAEAVGWDSRDAEVVVGTSAGSTSAALLRGGLPPADFVARMAGRPLSAEGAEVLRGLGRLRSAPQLRTRSRRPASTSLLSAMARRPWRYGPAHLAAGLLPEGTRSVMDGVAGIGSLFDTWPQRPTWICAVRLDDGQRVVFGRDATAHMADAVSASCAIPGYYAPPVIDGQRYVDGGVWSVHNLDLVAGLDLDLVVVSAPMSTDTWHDLGSGNAYRAPVRVQLEREARGVRRTGTTVVVITPDRRLRTVMGASTMDPSRRGPVARAATALVAELADAGALAPLGT
jgi:NTE family protein